MLTYVEDKNKRFFIGKYRLRLPWYKLLWLRLKLSWEFTAIYFEGAEELSKFHLMKPYVYIVVLNLDMDSFERMSVREASYLRKLSKRFLALNKKYTEDVMIPVEYKKLEED